MKTRTLLFLAGMTFIPTSCGGPGNPDPGRLSRMHGARGASEFTISNLAGALDEYRKAYAAAARADLPLQEAQCLFNTGRVYYELGFLDSAAAAFSAAPSG